MGKWNPMKQAFDPPATLAEFLLARIAEDAELARCAPASLGETGVRASFDPDGVVVEYGRWFDECEAKRRIVERAQSAARWAATEGAADYADDGREYAGAVADAWQEALLALAPPYSGHPDWREEWRP